MEKGARYAGKKVQDIKLTYFNIWWNML